MPPISRRSAIATLAAASAAATATTAVAARAEPPPATADPIFPLIGEHRRVFEALAWTGEDDDEFADAADKAGEILHRLCTTEPTTPAGCAAMLRHVMSVEDAADLPAPYPAMLLSLTRSLDRLADA